MVCNRDWFYDFHERNNSAKKILGDGRFHEIKGCGNVCVQLPNRCVKKIENVMYVPRIKKNLIFVLGIANKGMKNEFVKKS